jgi:hypothetical protein
MVENTKPVREPQAPVKQAGNRFREFYATRPLSATATAAFLITVAMMIISRQIGRAEAGDSSIWDYVAQSILRGQIPYRDVVEIKLPGAAYMSAAAMAIGKWVGLRDLIAVRLLNVAMLGVLSAVTCQVARRYIGSRPVAIIAFLVPLTSARFLGSMTNGTEPRLGMILFGMVTLLLIAKQRPFFAGTASALSCICWQPGLLFTGVAFVIFSRYMTRWRDLRALKVLAGAAVPLAVLLVYFAQTGAVRELWSWTFAYTFSVYAPEGFRGISGNALHIWNVTSRVLGPGVAFLGLTAIGFGMFVWETVRDRRKAGQGFAGFGDLFKDALLIAPLVYFLFCLIDFKSANYLIPATPFIGIFGGVATLELVRRLAAVRFARRLISDRSGEWLAVTVVLAVALGNALRIGRYRDRGLEMQTLQLKAVSDLLGPSGRIYAHGATEILAVLNRPNLNPYIFLDNNKDEYIAAHAPGGFQTIVNDMESAAPRLVVLSRLRGVAHRHDIEEWVAQHYDKLLALTTETGYDIYLRKP